MEQSQRSSSPPRRRLRPYPGYRWYLYLRLAIRRGHRCHGHRDYILRHQSQEAKGTWRTPRHQLLLRAQLGSQGQGALPPPQGLGCNRVIEVGGPSTIKQSLEAIVPGGHIAVIEFLTGMEKYEDYPSFLELFSRMCVVRGIDVGSRTHFEEMIRAIEVNDIRPVLDYTVFPLQQLQAVFQYQYEQKHFGKFVVSIP